MVVHNHFHSRRYQMEKNEIRLLTKDDIEVKVKKVSKDGAFLLLYKTARDDMAILDETYGSENWQNDYKEIKCNRYCGIGIYSKEKNEWIWKWDCGIESREDDEGNQKKGEASDAFKRAGFKVGIGRELYSAPSIYIKQETELDGKFYKLKDKFAKFFVKDIQFNENKEITKLVIVDRHGVQVFPINNNPTPPPEPKKEEPKEDVEKIKKNQITLENALKTSTLDMKKVNAWVKAKTKKEIDPAKLDDKTFNELIASINKPENQKHEEIEPQRCDDTIIEK